MVYSPAGIISAPARKANGTRTVTRRFSAKPVAPAITSRVVVAIVLIRRRVMEILLNSTNGFMAQRIRAAGKGTGANDRIRSRETMGRSNTDSVLPEGKAAALAP